MTKNTLFYIHDPMCSWCYAFKPVLQQLRLQLSKQYADALEFTSLLGGLAGDTQEPMSAELRQQLHDTWLRIEKKLPNTQFNYDFWQHWQVSKPRRSTYPACRAVIAAHQFDTDDTHHYEDRMIDAIQTAYYQQALNPSENTVLEALAKQIGLDRKAFQSVFSALQTHQILEQHLALCQKMKVQSYPSLVLKLDHSYWPISVDYYQADTIIETIDSLIEF